MEFISRIGSMIEQSHLSDKYIAAQLEVSLKTVYNWKKGISYPTFEKAFLLAELLQCLVDDLAEIKKDPS